MTQYKRESIHQLMRFLRHAIEDIEIKKAKAEEVVKAEFSPDNVATVATLRGALTAHKNTRRFIIDHFDVADPEAFTVIDMRDQ